MPYFVDPKAVERVPIGDTDWVELRTQIAGPEWYVIGSGTVEALSVFVVAWSFEDESGPIPVDVKHLAALDLPTFRIIDNWIAKNITAPALPNGSGAPSPGGTRERQSRTRTTRTRR